MAAQFEPIRIHAADEPGDYIELAHVELAGDAWVRVRVEGTPCLDEQAVRQLLNATIAELARMRTRRRPRAVR